MVKVNVNSITTSLLVVVLMIIAGRYFYFQPQFIQGEKAPDFSAETLDGSTFSLSDLRGKYVLLDFWGSWCGPCRRENPQLVKLYDKYRDAQFDDANGFEIVSVGVEADAARWERAIRSDRLDWPYHVLDTTSSLKFFNSEIARKYGVKQLPSKYLINERGTIIGVDPTPSELDALLARRSM